MRFLVMVKASPESEAPGFQPSARELAEMAKFNERLLDEGRIVLAEGLTSSAEGVRVVFEGEAEPKVIDGPFAETKGSSPGSGCSTASRSRRSWS
ncbi:YciI family protein [Amycolatopsis nalaikhensis]|uniref:YciI family protein n=1 Tax=Amycolatopsis nalaikhensis TaxID=715472 RepID=A0ABY8XXC9_9PSEU|nr:YciI family protein [Amycolatopsis sp. 2-2]WIV60299.1 YciI family protein [Amycolatopsis sp. 2-2]